MNMSRVGGFLVFLITPVCGAGWITVAAMFLFWN